MLKPAFTVAKQALFSKRLKLWAVFNFPQTRYDFHIYKFSSRPACLSPPDNLASISITWQGIWYSHAQMKRESSPFVPLFMFIHVLFPFISLYLFTQMLNLYLFTFSVCVSCEYSGKVHDIYIMLSSLSFKYWNEVKPVGERLMQYKRYNNISFNRQYHLHH